jgi:hypothetical protein
MHGTNAKLKSGVFITLEAVQSFTEMKTFFVRSDENIDALVQTWYGCEMRSMFKSCSFIHKCSGTATSTLLYTKPPTGTNVYIARLPRILSLTHGVGLHFHDKGSHLRTNCLFRPLTDTWEVNDCRITKNCKWLFMNRCKWKISVTMEFSNLPFWDKCIRVIEDYAKT